MRPPGPPRRTILAGAAAALAMPAPAREAPLRIFAAASLKAPLDVLAARWDGPVSASYAGSGTVARQLAAGAPADVVILAAVDWMDWLAGKGRVGPARIVARNALVLAAPAGAAPVALEAAAILARLGSGRLAMGDPLSVPAGRYGRQALTSLGLWDAVAPRLLQAESVTAALAYVARGDVPLALVYRSDARAPGVAAVADVPAGAHDPIVYPAAAVPGGDGRAGAFLDHVARGADVLAAHGFAPA